MRYRFATLDDIALLVRMNRQLTEDEEHRNRFQSDAWFEERMRRFLSGTYHAVLFDVAQEVVAYALYTDSAEHADTIYLRQIFVSRSHRRQGHGRQALRILREEIWPTSKRITVGVLSGNQAALAFYAAAGFNPYSVELEIPARSESAP